MIAIGAVALGVAVAIWAFHARHADGPLWRTSTVRRGDLQATITATGTVEPEEVVDVGAQVSGQFLSFGKDKAGKTIDYGSIVESNMLLATIDPALFKATVDLDKAVVASDKAGEVQAAANLEQMNAKEVEAEADWKRAQKLGPSEALAPTTYDSYKATYEIAKSNVHMAEAAVVSAKAATDQAIANLGKDQKNLDYCTISSPVNGVIIDRRVNIGETVASSMSTPSLFLIAKDLKRIQVWASVNEADIGNIHSGQPVTFTVDAYPNRVFQGTVNKVRLNATMTQNVVTYTVEVTTDNSDGKLLPYLTANVNFLAGETTNALLVLNAALRWHPPDDLIAPQFRHTAGKDARASEGPRAAEILGIPAERPGSSAGSGRQGHEHGGGGQKAVPSQKGTLWVEAENYVRPVQVDLGLTDGTWTEVRGEGLAQDATIVTGVLTAEAAADESAPGANPFVPQIFQRRGPTNAIPTRRGNGS